jgi:competence ComEA-like helix-hairpin-helix protein
VNAGRWLFAVIAACIAVWPATAKAAEPNPDLKAVQVVCGRCHTTAVFIDKPRSWERWNDVFADMTKRGANGTDEQLERVTRFFLENLTLVNVNTSAAEELAGVLGVSEEVAQAVIARRQEQRFSNVDQLRAIPGINQEKLTERKSRILL